MMPFFIGFGMLGIADFWPSYLFCSPYMTIFSLFSIILGDEISNSFMEVLQFDPFFGPLFMFAWVFLSMSILMNLFIIIVGESFEAVQATNKFNWLTDERVITMDKTQREFDDSSSSESESEDSEDIACKSQGEEDTLNSDEIGDEPAAKIKSTAAVGHSKVHERPMKKKLRSVRALKKIIEDDYNEWAGISSSINQ